MGGTMIPCNKTNTTQINTNKLAIKFPGLTGYNKPGMEHGSTQEIGNEWIQIKRFIYINEVSRW